MQTHRNAVLCFALGLASVALACERPPVDATQQGFRGLGTENVQNPRRLADKLEGNQAPEPLPPAPGGGPSAASVYQNVQVLGDLSVTEFARLMVAITSWVSPKEGCTYCHGENLASDEKYTKIVSRRMIQMTQNINSKWPEHVKQTGVTCYTCHRGQPVPEVVWSSDPTPAQPVGMFGNNAGQNRPAPTAGLTSLPYDIFTPFLSQDEQIRIQSETALPDGNRHSIKEAEWTYGLMIHMSESLGVNCTHCHNSRSFMPWESSTPARVNAWHAIRMVRALNSDYIESLTDVFPANRKGPAGDVYKANCGTCHRGLPKPLNGVSMLEHYPELRGGSASALPEAAWSSPPSPPLRSAQR